MSERIGLRLGKGMQARLREELVIHGLSGADMARALGIDLDDWVEIEEGRAGVDDTLYFGLRDAGIDMGYVIGGIRDEVVTPVFLSSRSAAWRAAHPCLMKAHGPGRRNAYCLRCGETVSVALPEVCPARAPTRGVSHGDSQ